MEPGELKNGEGYNKEILKLIQKLNISEENVEMYKTGYHDMKRERDSLINDISKYRKVLKVFARLIKYKLNINASDRYIQYQHMLDDIGINTDELEAD